MMQNKVATCYDAKQVVATCYDAKEVVATLS